MRTRYLVLEHSKVTARFTALVGTSGCGDCYIYVYYIRASNVAIFEERILGYGDESPAVGIQSWILKYHVTIPGAVHHNFFAWILTTSLTMARVGNGRGSFGHHRKELNFRSHNAATHNDRHYNDTINISSNVSNGLFIAVNSGAADVTLQHSNDDSVDEF